MNALCPQTTRRTRAIVASAAPVLKHGKDDHEVVLLDGGTCTRCTFLDWTDVALRHDGSADPEVQAWCDFILTTAGYAPTYIERRLDAERAAQETAKTAANIDTPPGLPVVAALVFVFGLLVTAILTVAAVLGLMSIIGTSTAATLVQAHNPAFVEWSE